MSTRLWESENPGEAKHGVEGGTGETSPRRYASFVVRGWRPGVSKSLEVAHDQSGERVQADSLLEAIGWIQARSMTLTPPANATQGSDTREQLAVMGSAQTEVAAA